MHVNGLSRTKDDIIEAQVKDIFKAQDFQDVIVRSHVVQSKLQSLGCFRHVDVYVDTSKGQQATPDGVEVCHQFLANLNFIIKVAFKLIYIL